MGLQFEVIVPEEFNEFNFLNEQNLEQSLKQLAVQKARLVADTCPEALVLGADTVVVDGTTLLGKPADYQHAFTMLRSLSGKTHKVMTGVALLCSELHFIKCTIATTEVTFRSISDQEIQEYLSTEEYCDKAGAYAIQGEAMIFVESIRGCYYNVVGLPVVNTIGLFKEFVVRKESADV
jgi:septum formation protein